MTEGFTPELHPYLTFIPTRRPRQKLHMHLGHAKNAINAQMGYESVKSPGGSWTYTRKANVDMHIYEYGADGIQLLYTIPKGTLTEDLPWKVKK